MKRKFFAHIIIVSAAILLLTGCTENNERTNDSFLDITDSGMIESMGTMEHDWGNINIAGGNVSRDFVMRNNGEDDLYLKGAATSCMCTTAEIFMNGESISPKFAMHNNPMNWTYAVHPGEEFTVRAVFDPMAHGPKATGPIQRSVVLITSSEANDIAKLNNQEKRGNVTGFMMQGDVLSEEDYKAKTDVATEE